MAKSSASIKGLVELKEEFGRIEPLLNEELRRTATNLISNLAFQTPKKTGEATGEWQATINQRATAKTGRLDLTGATVATTESAVIETAKNFVLPIIYVSNLADHIVDLNQGTSAQAPAKFIERALTLAERAQ